MKLHALAVAFLVTGYSVLSQNSGVVISEDLNSTPDQSSILDVQSNAKGVLISRMSAAERDAIQSPAQGLLVYVNDDNGFYFWNQIEWKKIGAGELSGFVIQDDGNQRQSISALGLNTTTINSNASIWLNYDSNNDGTNDGITIGRNRNGESGGTTDLTIKEGDVLVHDGALAFQNGVGQNLVSQYLSDIEFATTPGKYVSINTNIGFTGNAMMSKLKISYWSYGYNYEIHVGWYTYGTPLGFYSPNAYITGLTPGDISGDIVLSNNNGKAQINIPYGFFQRYGNLTVSSENSAIYLNDDWYKGWEIVKNNLPTGVDNKVVNISDRSGKTSTNLATANQIFTEARSHNLGGNGFRLYNGPISFGNVGPSNDVQVFTASNTHNWVSIIRNYNNAKHGLLVDAMSNSGSINAFKVRGGETLSKTIISAKADGEVGIGTDNPEAQLHVVGSGIRADRFSVSGINDRINDAPWYGIGRSNATDLSNDGTLSSVQMAGHAGLRLKTQDGEINLHQNGNVGIGGAPSTGGNKFTVYGPSLLREGVYVYRDANPFVEFKNQTKKVGQIREYTNGLGFYMYDGTAWSWSGYAAENGNFGVGTTSPTRKLDVDGDAYIKDQVGIGTYFIPENQLSVASNNADWIGYFRQGGTDANSHGVKIDVYNDNGTSNVLRVRSQGAGGWNELITANAHGKVGFGTAYPQETVHVKGTFQIETPTASTVGQVWTATSADGKGEWADAGAGSGQFNEHSSGNLFLPHKFLSLGNLNPPYRLTVSGNESNWLSYFHNKNATGYGVLIDNDAPDRVAFKVRTKIASDYQNTFVVNGNGNIGIGTNANTSRLDVRSDAVGTIFKAADVADTDGFSVNRVSATKMNATLKKSTADVEFRAERTTSSGATAVLRAENNLTVVGSETPDALSIITNNESRIHINSNGHIGIGTHQPQHFFHVYGDATSVFEHDGGRKLVISPANGMLEMTNAAFAINRNSTTDVSLANGGGDVGVGTLTPNEDLHVREDAHNGLGATIKLENNTGGGDNKTAIQFTDGTYSSWIKGGRYSSLTKSFLSFETTDAERMRIDGYGRVGIGTTNPTASLQIEGDARIRLSDNANSNTAEWDINQVGADGLVIEKVGSTGQFKLADDGQVVIKSDNMKKLVLESTSEDSPQLIEFKSPTTTTAMIGVAGSSDQNFRIQKFSSGDLLLHGGGSGNISLRAADKVKIETVLNLQVSTALPTTNLEVGDVVIIDNSGNAEMWVYLSGGWSKL